MLKRQILTALILMAFGFVSMGSSPTFVNALPQNGMPTWIAGYKVMGLYTSADVACMPKGEARLLLQDSEIHAQGQIAHNRVEDVKTYLQQNKIAGEAKVQIAIVGPNITPQEILETNQQWNDWMKAIGCIRLSPVTAATSGGDWTELKFASPKHGWAVVQNTDAALYSDITAQSVIFNAPVIGTHMDHSGGWAAILNNVVSSPEPDFFFLQNGLLFAYCCYTVGSLVWSDTYHGLIVQNYNLAYVTGDQYQELISYEGNNTWAMCEEDLTQSRTECSFEQFVIGTTVIPDINTSVFVENENSHSSWYSGFTDPLTAYSARYYRSGTGTITYWSSQARMTWDACKSNWPPTSAISGSIIGGNTIYFYLEGVPLAC